MRNLKKFLALVLAMMMTLSLMVTVNAKNVEFEDGESVNEAFIDDLTVLAGMGVIRGQSTDKFAPLSTVTRAEMAAIVYRLSTGDADADPEYKDKSDMYAGYGDFTDVTESNWFSGYVGYCANAGIIIGYPDGTFGPNKPVTGYEALVMLLRAMGYDQPNEFSGKDWRQHAASIATQRGMLAKVNTTSYRGTLMNGAAREVIAEIAFQAATKAQVEWTAAFGYQTAPVNGVLTGDTVFKSLGERWFGLTKTTSIILGNQATGESGTLLSALKMTYTVGTNTYEVDNVAPYAYPGVEIAKTVFTDAGLTDPGAAVPVPTGLKLAGKTGLDLFGHKVEAWYNADDPSAAKQTYAILDRANLAKTVYSPDGTDGNKLSDVAFTTNAAAAKSLGAAAMAAGFDVDLEASEAHESNVYDRITNATVAKATTASPNGLYALVSNNSDKTVDVIVALSAEVAEITQKNTIANTQTLTLAGRGTNATTPAQIAASTFKNGDPGTAGVIYVKSLVEGSETELGAKVTAWQVKGTNDATAYKDADKATKGTAGTNKNMPYFQLDKVTKSVTGTVVSYDSTANGKLTMSDGKVYERSYLWSKVVKGAIQTPLNAAGAVEFQAGVNYTIWLDDDGRWLGATTAYSDFLYGTYADYTVGELGSAEMKYYVTGVTIDGEIVKNVPMTSLFQNSQDYPDAATGDSLGDGYNELLISKKDLGNSGNGNQILTGAYTGYLKDAEGNFVADDTDTNKTGVQLGDVQLLNDTGKKWTITKDDVANGFADLNTPKDGKLVATKDTTFILVSGTGVNDVKVEKLQGIEALLKGYSKVELDASALATSADNTPYGNTYYIMAADRFNKVDTSNNTLVDTVILDARDLTYTGATSLFFALDANTTDVVLAGTNSTDVKQYKLYNDGELGTYFVTTETKYGGVAPTGGNSDGDFFELVKVYEVNGVPVYKAVAATGQNSTANLDMANTTCDTEVLYSYVGVSNLQTVWLQKGTGKVLANVANAKVVDVEFNADCDHAEIKSIEDLNRAVSGDDALSGAIKVAIVNDGINVSMIYVTYVHA